MAKPDPTRATLRAAVARKKELEAKRDRLEAAQTRAVAAISAADIAINTAQRDLDAARAAHVNIAADAFAAGVSPAPMPSAARQRSTIMESEDAKGVATRALEKIRAELGDVGQALIYDGVRSAAGEALAPHIRALIDGYANAASAALQFTAALGHLHAGRYIPAELEREAATVLGLIYSAAPGTPGSMVRPPNLAPLQGFLEALKNDPDAPAPALAF
jgi:hypothetical protein